MCVQRYRLLAIALVAVVLSVSVCAAGPLTPASASTRAQVVKAVKHRVHEVFRRADQVDVLNCARRGAKEYRCHWFTGTRLGVHGDYFWAEGFARAKDTNHGVRVRIYHAVSVCGGSGHYC